MSKVDETVKRLLPGLHIEKPTEEKPKKKKMTRADLPPGMQNPPLRNQNIPAHVTNKTDFLSRKSRDEKGVISHFTGTIRRKKEHRKGRGKGHPSSGAELLMRLRIVEQALIDGKRGQQIVEDLEHALGKTLSMSAVREYCLRIRDKWAEEDDLLRPIWRERQLRKVHDVALKLEQQEAWGHWVQTQKLIADLEGNLSPVKVDVSQGHSEFDDWTLEELQEFISNNGEEIPGSVIARRKGTLQPPSCCVPKTAKNENLH